MEGAGFEPAYAVKRADLQSAGINHSPTLPGAECDGLTPAQMRPKRDPASQRSASYSDGRIDHATGLETGQNQAVFRWRRPEIVAARTRRRPGSPGAGPSREGGSSAGDKPWQRDPKPERTGAPSKSGGKPLRGDRPDKSTGGKPYASKPMRSKPRDSQNRDGPGGGYKPRRFEKPRGSSVRGLARIASHARKEAMRRAGSSTAKRSDSGIGRVVRDKADAA